MRFFENGQLVSVVTERCVVTAKVLYYSREIQKYIVKTHKGDIWETPSKNVIPCVEKDFDSTSINVTLVEKPYSKNKDFSKLELPFELSKTQKEYIFGLIVCEHIKHINREI